jgi:threonine synthase
LASTPLIKLNAAAAGCVADIYVKCEWFNPLSSVKDRIAMSMIETAENDGELKPGGSRDRADERKHRNRAWPLCAGQKAIGAS